MKHNYLATFRLSHSLLAIPANPANLANRCDSETENSGVHPWALGAPAPLPLLDGGSTGAETCPSHKAY